MEVIRDRSGVPHIYARNPHDLFLAQGYVHAQDRFWQMDFWRHISHGRLAEMFGSSQVETDSFLRALGFTDLAERQYAAETAEVRAILDAYSLGVNRYLATQSPSDLSFEYTILEVLNHGYDPESWTGVDSLAWGKVMSWDLGGNMTHEIVRSMALGTMSADRVDQLYPPYPGDRHPFIVDSADAAEDAQRSSGIAPSFAIDAHEQLSSAGAAIRALDALTGGGVEGIGSNSWAVSGCSYLA